MFRTCLLARGNFIPARELRPRSFTGVHLGMFISGNRTANRSDFDNESGPTRWPRMLPSIYAKPRSTNARGLRESGSRRRATYTRVCRSDLQRYAHVSRDATACVTIVFSVTRRIWITSCAMYAPVQGTTVVCVRACMCKY